MITRFKCKVCNEIRTEVRLISFKDDVDTCEMCRGKKEEFDGILNPEWVVSFVKTVQKD